MGFVDRIVVNVLVEPLKQEFALSDTQVSLLGFAFAVLSILVGIAVSRFIERGRRLDFIAFGTLFWSLATAACGIALSWPQLLAARLGVGLGEAVGLPGNQSVIADYFPRNRRGLAMSILLLAPPIGALIGFVGGGLIAQHYSWRWTFLIAAIPGLVLAAMAWLLVAEPPRGQHDAGDAGEIPPFREVLRRLFALGSARNLVIASSLASASGFGLNYFFTSLMLRRFELNIGEAGLYAGIMASLPAALSIVATGWLGDRLGDKRPAAYALIPAASLLIAGPLYAFAITRSELPILLGVVAFSALFQFGYIGITFATIQNLMHPRMRASASAVLNAIYSVAGGIGPLVLGALSDAMAPRYGAGTGLAYAMALLALLYVWAALHYLLAARHLRSDIAATTDLGRPD